MDQPETPSAPMWAPLIPPRRVSTPLDLTDARLIVSVHVIREAGEGNALQAAIEVIDSSRSVDMEGQAARYGTGVTALFDLMKAVRAVRYHRLDEETIAAFGSLPYSDGAVTVLAAADLPPGEISDYIHNRTRPNLPALVTLLALRGYRVPDLDGSGAPEFHHRPPPTAGINW